MDIIKVGKCGLGLKKCTNANGCCRTCNEYDDCDNLSKCENHKEICKMYHEVVKRIKE